MNACGAAFCGVSESFSRSSAHTHITLRRRAGCECERKSERRVAVANTAFGMGPNRGGGRRTGGGGHQPGQKDMSVVKLKKEQEKAAKRGSRADAAKKAKTPEFLQQKSGGASSSKSGGKRGESTEERLVMSANTQALVSSTLAKMSSATRNASSTSLSEADVRHDVDRDDVIRKAAQAVAKKGFGMKDIERALAATKSQAEVEQDACEGFNEQKRRAIARAMDWLILNVDEADLPEALRSEAAKVRKGRKGKPGSAGAGEQKAADGVEQMIEAFARAGFGMDAAKVALEGANGNTERALDDLCAALGPSRAEALEDALEAFAESGAEAASEEDIRGVLRNAQYDELSSMPREWYKPRGYNPASGTAVLAIEIVGIVQLGAVKQYAADLEVTFKNSPLYPFELPGLKFTHPTLNAEASVAVSTAMMRHAASLV